MSLNLQPVTSQQLRSFSNVNDTVTKIYFRIVESAKQGWKYVIFDVETQNCRQIMYEIYRLFPDTKIIELYSYNSYTTYRASWSDDRQQRGALDLPILR
jgi:hypothetical protein